jgi:hypothetical protein
MLATMATMAIIAKKTSCHLPREEIMARVYICTRAMISILDGNTCHELSAMISPPAQSLPSARWAFGGHVTPIKNTTSSAPRVHQPRTHFVKAKIQTSPR